MPVRSDDGEGCRAVRGLGWGQLLIIVLVIVPILVGSVVGAWWAARRERRMRGDR